MTARYNGISIYDGALPNAKTAIYTVASGYRLHLSHITLTNVGAGTARAQIWVNRGTSRLIIDCDLDARDCLYFNGYHPLIVGDMVEIKAAVAATIDATIAGTLELLS
jgi:hypothetical protein